MSKILELHENIDAIAVIGPDSNLNIYGKPSGNYEFASVTKILSTLVIADAVQSGFLTFNDLVESDSLLSNDVTMADLLSHSSGMRPEGQAPIEKHLKRIYTNEAFELAETFLISKLGTGFEKENIGSLFNEGLKPHLNCTISFQGSCAKSAKGSLEDLVSVLQELRNPTFIDADIFSDITNPYLKNLEGILPGWGNYIHNTFGIGFEVKGDKSPHWTGDKSSSSTFGHFGQSGVFIFHDPVNEISVACVTKKDFGPWAKQEFPLTSNSIYDLFDL